MLELDQLKRMDRGLFQERNSRLVRILETSDLGWTYVLPQDSEEPESDDHAILKGSSTDTAVCFFSHVLRSKLLINVCDILFVGAEGRCFASPDDGFPVAVRRRKLIFFQNDMDWQGNALTFTLQLICELLVATLDRDEVIAIHEAVPGCEYDCFLDHLTRSVTGNPRHANRVHHDFGNERSYSIKKIVDNSLKTDVLDRRASRIADYKPFETNRFDLS